MKVGIDAQLSYVHQNKADSDLQTLMASNPLGSLYNEDGSINPQPVADPSSTVYNYLLNEDKSLYRNQAQNLKVYFNPYLEITPLKGLTFINSCWCLVWDIHVVTLSHGEGLGSMV